MSTFSFKCEDCDNEFDIYGTYNDTKDVKCPKCESVKVNRVFKPIAMNLNFSGSYNSTRNK